MQSKESIIFDKAKWHLNGDFPSDLPHINVYTHTGFFLGWLIENELINSEFKSNIKEEINLLINKELSPIEIYESKLDGVFSSEDLNKEGILFAKKYFDFESGNYLADYENTLCSNLPTLFHVEDDWENYKKISLVISERYEAYLGSTKNSFFSILKKNLEEKFKTK